MRIFRSRLFSPLSDPFGVDDLGSTILDLADGALAVDDDGTIAWVGAWSDLPSNYSDAELIDCGRRALITPGLIDTHLHAPQLEMIGSYGGHLLEWLNRYTFPTEAKFADKHHAEVIAESLFGELLKNGTTTALIFSTIHREATDVFFAEAERRGFRAIIGKTLMDRNAPDALLENADDAWENSRALIEKWHERGMARYAVTPRFAPTSTRELLTVAGRLKSEYPDVYVQTHVSENRHEVAWVHELFPEAKNYVDVYDSYGLLSEKTVLAHGVHLTDDELDRMRETGARVAHCPNSNLFLGSGLFPLSRVHDHGVRVGLGSDIGAGTTASLLSAMADAYKVQQVNGVSLSPVHLWYLATLGGASALSLDDRTGSLEAGKDADFIVLDLEATSLLKLRTANAVAHEDLLAGLIFMGDERAVQRAVIRGRTVHTRA